jgi:hypothetical protein
MSFEEEAFAAFRRGETDLVEQHSRVELQRARECADSAAEVEALSMLLRVAIRRGSLDVARELAVEALKAAVNSGDRRLEHIPRHALAALARMSGDLDKARSLYITSITLSESLALPSWVVTEKHNLGYVELHAGDLERARQLFDSARREARRLEITDLMPYLAVASAVMADIDGDQRSAVELLAAAEGALRARGEILDPDDAAEQEALRRRLIDELGQAQFDAYYAVGATRTLPDALPA